MRLHTPRVGPHVTFRDTLQKLLLFSLLLSVAGTLSFAQSRPSFESVRIGAFDASAWNGVVFLTRAFHQPASFAFRVGSERRVGSLLMGQFIDGSKIYNAVSQVGPHAPDGSYCRMAWRQPPSEAQVTLAWSRVNQTTVVGRLAAGPHFRLVLETYFPYSHGGSYHLDRKDQAILGQAFFNQVFGSRAQFVLMVNRPLIGSGIYPSLAQVGEDMRGSGKLTSSHSGEPNAAGLEFTTGPSGTAYFVAKVGWSRNTLLSQARDWLQNGKIGSILRQKSAAYGQQRPTVTGLFSDAAHAIGNSMFWNSVYAPSDKMVFPSISRSWAPGWGGWVVGEWDCFFGALLTSLESKRETDSGVKAILMAQTPTGLVPNMVSENGKTPDRSEPPVGAYSIWKIYQRFHNRKLLEWAYPRLKTWHEWWFANRGDGQPWRDGNHDGLLEWGSDRGSSPSVGGRGYLQAAKWESGMDDSPMWDHVTYNTRTYTLNMDDVGLNSLFALGAESLARMALALGKDQDARHFSDEYNRTKKLMQEKLWNPAAGIYENRYWDGRFSKQLSPTNFYPLIAGIATPAQARQMVEKHLLNPKEFWGKYVIPTIARNNPAFADQFYWRGDIWGPTNYLVYEGLNRYHFDKVALEYAEKNYNLFMGDWRRHQHDDEQYHAWGGSGGGDIHYTWGALLCLVSLEQYINSNPWDNLRFGALDPPERGEFRRVEYDGQVYSVSIGPDITQLVRDGVTRFQASSGVVVRDYTVKPTQVSFTIHAGKETQVTTEEFPAGSLVLKIDGKQEGRIAVQNGKASFSVPAGEHTVGLQK